MKTLVVHSSELWQNNAIDRGLDAAAIKAVTEDFVKHGNGEWEVRVWEEQEEATSRNEYLILDTSEGGTDLSTRNVSPANIRYVTHSINTTSHATLFVHCRTRDGRGSGLCGRSRASLVRDSAELAPCCVTCTVHKLIPHCSSLHMSCSRRPPCLGRPRGKRVFVY